MSSQTLPDLDKLKESLAKKPTDLELLKKIGVFLYEDSKESEALLYW